ncbi:cysteine rich repeat-containing protein [Neorhizobium alkalisoli]|uniref:Cysteine rich repeat protein n=1 Tax=Neorhizobium alkalisoli TaxID=528178 RepID=A0A561R8Q5_9HYPH|nr:cysteine rich repeat-containing protein [Neorhizobium alkalisoli]TWF58967.1 cysteine rich repeat protein [Neorhizobium alkalisoli]
MLKYFAVAFLASTSVVSAQQLSMSDKLALRDNCKDDIQKLCPGIKPGDGGLMACIKTNKEKLSPTCSSTIKDVLAKREN